VRARTNDTVEELLACVTLEGVREHRRRSGRSPTPTADRFSGLSGHDKSVQYVVQRLQAAGYRTRVQPFDYLAFAVLGPSALSQTAPTPTDYVEGVNFAVLD
jgi:hypothetical protein